MKTGTSAFQAHMLREAPEHVLYPEAGRWSDGAHHRITFALLGRDTLGDTQLDPPQQMLDRLSEELRATKADVLISSELLQPETAQALVQRLDGFDRVQAILAVRHPLERAASSYNQAVKDPQVAERNWPDAFLRTAPHRFTTKRLYRTWQEADLPITWVNYHPAASTTARLCAAINLPQPGDQVPRANRSMSGFGLVGLLATHRLNLSLANRNAVFATMREQYGRRIWRGESFPFTRGAVRRFLDDIARPDLDWTRGQLGFDLQDLYPRPPAPFRLTSDDIEALLACFDGIDMSTKQRKRLDNILHRFQRKNPRLPDPQDDHPIDH